MECPEAMSLLRLSWGSTMRPDRDSRLPLKSERKSRQSVIRSKCRFWHPCPVPCAPDLVVAAQRIASLNPLVTADVYDIAHFPELKEKYNVMSVPCLVINQDKVTFGKKNIQQLLEVIGTGNSNEI